MYPQPSLVQDSGALFALMAGIVAWGLVRGLRMALCLRSRRRVRTDTLLTLPVLLVLLGVLDLTCPTDRAPVQSLQAWLRRTLSTGLSGCGILLLDLRRTDGPVPEDGYAALALPPEIPLDRALDAWLALDVHPFNPWRFLLQPGPGPSPASQVHAR